MRRTLMVCAISMAAAAAGCNAPPLEGSGNVVTETRDIEGVNAVSLSLQGELHVRQADEESLMVTADDNLLPYIATVVSEGRLEIRESETCAGRDFRPTAPIRYELAVRDLGGIAVRGSGAVRADTLACVEMGIALSGSGDVAIESLEADEIDVAISGSGDVTVGGSARVQSVAVSGSGSYEAGALRTETAAVAVSGSGDVTVWAEASLDIGVSGSGEVSYYGDPKVEQRVSGSGTVRPMGRRSEEI
ncbi:MAG: hypothetical protein GF400_10740 [Candidatus Eisenbacteria bacterium]|nr:hypothetical protein [Candidatus Eisenbacteria bacterium]